MDAVALAPDIRDERGADDEGQAEQEQIDRDRVAGEEAVRHGVEGGLREVEQARQADDQAVDFAEGGEAENFGGVVAAEWG